jgi:hypothetical protein
MDEGSRRFIDCFAQPDGAYQSTGCTIKGHRHNIASNCLLRAATLSLGDPLSSWQVYRSPIDRRFKRPLL